MTKASGVRLRPTGEGSISGSGCTVVIPTGMIKELGWTGCDTVELEVIEGRLVIQRAADQLQKTSATITQRPEDFLTEETIRSVKMNR